MNINDYVRTKDGYISKIKELGINIYTDVGCWSKYYVIKSSPNIIDLIEAGDYVNGYYVTTGNQGVGSIYIAEIDGLGLKKKLYEKDITSIVTKEQFEAMKYEIK